MARRKKVVLDIYQILADHGAITVDKGVEILQAYEPKPDLSKLEAQYWRDRFRRIMQSKRDKGGIRDIYSNEKGTYYNVPTSKDRTALSDIDAQITAKRDQLIRVQIKVQNRRAEVAGQMDLGKEFKDSAISK